MEGSNCLKDLPRATREDIAERIAKYAMEDSQRPLELCSARSSVAQRTSESVQQSTEHFDPPSNTRENLLSGGKEIPSVGTEILRLQNPGNVSSESIVLRGRYLTVPSRTPSPRSTTVVSKSIMEDSYIVMQLLRRYRGTLPHLVAMIQLFLASILDLRLRTCINGTKSLRPPLETVTG
jgi:hypothetical protein